MFEITAMDQKFFIRLAGESNKHAKKSYEGKKYYFIFGTQVGKYLS